MEHGHQFLYFFLHIDTYLIPFIQTYGTWAYLLLFTVIFCETGLIITPFLPGDALLFTVGSIAALPGNPLHLFILLPLLITASILGNQVNYLLGRAIGPRVFSINRPWLFNQENLEEAHRFYEKHGGKTLVFARFIPVVRTFVPFIAGVSYMSIRRFTTYNIGSALLWIGSILNLGYFLGSIPVVKNNFSVVVYGIILVSFLPLLYTFLYPRLIKAR